MVIHLIFSVYFHQRITALLALLLRSTNSVIALTFLASPILWYPLRFLHLQYIFPLHHFVKLRTVTSLPPSTADLIRGLGKGLTLQNSFWWIPYEATPHKSVDYRAFKRGFQALQKQSQSLYMEQLINTHSLSFKLGDFVGKNPNNTIVI